MRGLTQSMHHFIQGGTWEWLEKRPQVTNSVVPSNSKCSSKPCFSLLFPFLMFIPGNSSLSLPRLIISSLTCFFKSHQSILCIRWVSAQDSACGEAGRILPKPIQTDHPNVIFTIMCKHTYVVQENPKSVLTHEPSLLLSYDSLVCFSFRLLFKIMTL